MKFILHQLEKISQLSEQFSIGSAHFSTRENIQLHWVVLEDVSEIFRGLTEVGLNIKRSMWQLQSEMLCAVLCRVFVLMKNLIQLHMPLQQPRFFLRNPMAQNLPRKFKFNFTCCEKHGMVRMVDVGLIPQIREIDGTSQRGF